MTAPAINPARLSTLCQEITPAQGLPLLLERLQQEIGGRGVNWVLTRSGWHRLGGVVDADRQPISDNLRHWVEQVSEGEIDTLLEKYLDAGYFATHLAGKTHYFVLAYGDQPKAFLQLEVEEIQTVLDRPLLDPDWYPDSLEEIIEPLEVTHLESEPLGEAYYQFRRITDVGQLLEQERLAARDQQRLVRFFADWQASSAYESGHLSSHWVMALREYIDAYGEQKLGIKPISTFQGKLPDLPPGGRLYGVDLANAIHGYDRTLGYPFSWFFIMLSRKSSNYALANAVFQDQMGAYDYLPPKDLKVLRNWEANPYAL